ncbi:alkaline phosphatase 4-like [Hetaerina americana]|uniref:alkaline phosphatase 4-like n=1 Tax=Hetaerina americana TaxID=62018 RepID=UPI003A7F4CEF
MKAILIVILLMVLLQQGSASDTNWLLQDTDYWIHQGTKDLKEALERPTIGGRAKNVIIFLGDGMGLSTVTATRIYKGQLEGGLGEEALMTFEKFPSTGLAKTYNVDKQVPDSAGTATAIFSGVKSKFYMVGFDVKALYNECDQEINQNSAVTSIMKWAQDAGKSTGFVTTTRVTHATPAALYAHVNHRDWECDGSIPAKELHCTKDIARQLVEDEPGRGFQVIMGGGWNALGTTKIEDEDESCIRLDGRNLINDWKKMRAAEKVKYQYVYDTESLMGLNTSDIDYLLGVFSPGHLQYNSLRDRSPKGQPSLVNMTSQAMKILQKNENGYVLMVEGGRIDHAHHENYARLALQEGVEFDAAIQLVMSFVDTRETLVVVTADHSHTFTINGYPPRGNDILGLANYSKLNYSYETLTYANGPSYHYHRLDGFTEPNNTWRNVAVDDTRGRPYYQHFSPMYMDDETHAGEDVPIYAIGPHAHLLQGVHEQSYIAHVISYSACIGPHRSLCNNYTSGATEINVWALLPLLTINFIFAIKYQLVC